MNYVWIFIGGGLGSMARFLISNLLSKYNYNYFLASVILGFFLAQALAGNGSDFKKALIMTGFCGGFSTFSTFSAESFQLLQQGQFGYAALNIGGSILV